MFFFFFNQKPAYEWRIRDWSSGVSSSDPVEPVGGQARWAEARRLQDLHPVGCQRTPDARFQPGEGVYRRPDIIGWVDDHPVRLGEAAEARQQQGEAVALHDQTLRDRAPDRPRLLEIARLAPAAATPQKRPGDPPRER